MPFSTRALVSFDSTKGLLLILGLHAIALCWSATRQSPTLNEPAFLAAGVYSWKTGRYDLSHVNPPLVRQWASAPLMLCDFETDWSSYDPDPRSRSELNVGRDFFHANRPHGHQLLLWARWTCIPFSLLGGIAIYLWGKALYGDRSGLAAAALWCSDPNIIAHGQFIMTDVATASLWLSYSYAFWQWMLKRTWGWALAAGAFLGATQLCKFSAVILLITTPVIGVIALLLHVARAERASQRSLAFTAAAQGLFAAFVSLYVINAGYGFEGSLQRLGDYEFHSHLFSKSPDPFKPGNRFRAGILGGVPVPLPKEYLQGMDTQQRDLERFPYPSFLAGEWKQGGWWYYYLYGFLVKTPIGTLCLFLSGCVLRLRTTSTRTTLLGEVLLVVPLFVLFVVVSRNTVFNHHFRYVLPCYGAVFLVAGLVFSHRPGCDPIVFRVLRAACLVAVIASTSAAFPWTLSYFNELAGGMRQGHRHLLHSSLDWGQGLLAYRDWCEAHPEARPRFLAYYGACDPSDLGIDARPPPDGPQWRHFVGPGPFQPGWYGLSANFLWGAEWMHTRTNRYQWFRDRTPETVCGGSISIYHVSEEDAAALTSMGADSAP